MLKALPSFNAPRDRWSQVRSGVLAERRRGWWMRGAWAAAATAAIWFGANGLIQSPAATDAEPELQALAQQSAQLDSLLVVVAERTRVVNALTALAIVDLEDRVNRVDSRILVTRRADLSELQREQLRLLLEERVALMDALVNAHVQRASYVGF
jgi:hypothetical protein